MNSAMNDNILPGATAPEAPAVEAWSGKDKGDENFPVGSVLIAKALRPHVHAFYSFARNADDIADSDAISPDEKIVRLNAMEEVLLDRAETAPSAARLRESWRKAGFRPFMRANCWWRSGRTQQKPATRIGRS
jgi:hypothetical protein